MSDASPTAALPAALYEMLVDRLNVGIVTVGPDFTVLSWNRFMQAHSGRNAGEIVGGNLLDCFPDLPREWLERKVRSVFLLKNFSFTSWRQRPHLFCFQNHRLMTGGQAAMRQDCAMVPLIEAGVVRAVSIVLINVTDTYESETRLDVALQELAAQSMRDGLTGVFNRRKLDESIESEFQRVKRYGGDCGLFIFDIDHFKKVNDGHGHLVGDEAIRHVAQLAVKTLRTTDIVGRYGGEEFVCILPGVGLAGAAVAAERLRVAIETTPVRHPDVTLSITVSAGVTTVRADAKDRLVVMDEADRALYQSKHGGRNRVTTFAAPAVSVGGSPAGTDA